MAYTTKKKSDDTLAPKLKNKSLTLAGKALASFGKPLYVIFSYLVVVILFLFHITGHFFRVSLTNLFHYLISLAYALLINLPASVFRFIKTKVEETKAKRAELSKNLLTITWGQFSFVSKKALILLLNGLAYFLKTSGTLAKSLWRTFKRLAGFLRKKVSYVEPRVKLTIVTLRLRLKLARLISYSFRIRVSKAKNIAFASILFLLMILTSAGVYLATVVLYDLPSPEMLRRRNVEVSTKIYDRNGVLLYKIFKDQNRTPVSLSEIPPVVRYATIAIEDAEFYNHPGFSVRGILRAAIRNLRQGELTGGSTITQQLVKNALLSSEKTLVRKLREVVLAVKVELAFSKDEILEMYLNEVSYGGTAYGIQEAARLYFGKDVGQLTLAEAALLAGLPKTPTKYSPFGTNPERAFARQKEVLRLMLLNGFISKDQAKSAERQNLSFAPEKTDIKAPHFVMFVRDALVTKYGEEVVAKGGLEVATTLDYRIQVLAEEAVKEEVKKLERLNVRNGAALVLDTQTGEILAMVGSYDYFDKERDGNVNVTTRPRQPGSSIKVVNYSYALANGYTPATILEDTPVTFKVQGLPPYTPKNYDGTFRGKLTLRSALAESRNVPAVKVLASYGVAQMFEQGRKMGITTWSDPYDFGLSLTLGGGEVTLLDLSRVYATIANYGRKPNLISILKVTNYKGKVLEENECVEYKTACLQEQVVDPRVAYILIDILRDNAARTPAFGSKSLLVIPEHEEVAVKTGTSNDLRDNLAIGFNQKYLVASWVGNNDNSPMGRVASGVTGATPIFHRITSALLAREPNHEWVVPRGLVQIPVCTITGTLSCKGCPTRSEWFLEENKPTRACNPEYIKYLNEQKEKEEEQTEDQSMVLE